MIWRSRKTFAFALQQQGSFYKSYQWTLRVDSFQKAHEETKEFSEEIRGKEILGRFYSWYQEPLAALVDEAVRIFAGIVCKLPSTSLRERTRIVEQHIQDCVTKPNTRKGPVERWLMEACGWKGPPDVLIGVYERKSREFLDSPQMAHSATAQQSRKTWLKMAPSNWTRAGASKKGICTEMQTKTWIMCLKHLRDCYDGGSQGPVSG